MKNKILVVASLLCVSLGFSASVFALNTDTQSEQSIRISNSCGSIRQNLKNLQRSDARARTYFGSIYETISSKFLKPLNLRLVNNDLANPTLLELQTSLATSRTDFSDDYISYSKSLEELIAIDCRLEPEKFYERLVDVRAKRAEVSADVKKLNGLLTAIVKTVEPLKESLDEQ